MSLGWIEIIGAMLLILWLGMNAYKYGISQKRFSQSYLLLGFYSLCLIDMMVWIIIASLTIYTLIGANERVNDYRNLSKVQQKVVLEWTTNMILACIDKDDTTICGPTNDATDWQQRDWDFYKSQDYYHDLIYFFLNLDYFLYILIGTALMTSMGQLAVQMKVSIEDIVTPQEDAKSFSTKCQYRTVFAIGLMFCFGDAVYLVYVMVKEQDFNPLIPHKMESDFEKYST